MTINNFISSFYSTFGGLNWKEIFIGATVSLIVGVLFSTPLRWFLSASWKFILTPSARSLNGYWNSDYWYLDENGKKISHKDQIKLKQYGAYLKGKNEGSTDHRYKLTGRLHNNNVFTGIWKSIHPHVTYHGTFQLIVSHNGREMWGKWLGIDNPDLVEHGEWRLERVNNYS